ncbi:MAG: outer membrane protein assembly factor BamD (BamD/ComL family), partial [Saprospiraceae bacterium]
MTIHKILFLCFTTLFLTNCIDAPTTDSSTKDKPNMQAKAIYSKALDTHTYARPKEAVTKHLSLNLDVNF